MTKTIWTFGLIAGSVISALMLLLLPFEQQIGPDRGEIVGYTTMVAAFLLVFFGIRSYRDNVGGGRIRFWRGVTVGVLITAITSLCYTATWEALFFGRPAFAAHFQEAQAAQVKASGKSQAEIDKRLADLQHFAELYKNPAFNSAITFLEPLPVGLIIAFVSAGILSRKRRGVGGQVAATA